MAVVQSLDLLFHLPLLVLGIGHLQQRLHLCEQTPPLPVAQFQVALHIALDDANGTELLHTLLVSSDGRDTEMSGFISARFHDTCVFVHTNMYIHVHVHCVFTALKRVHMYIYMCICTLSGLRFI